MNNKIKNVLLVILGVVVVLLVVRVAFDKKFDDFSRYVKERENYEDGPEAFDKNLDALGKWIEDYKSANPGASDEDAAAAFKAAWEK